jgi:Xaa-Pro aminopeptidase
VSTQADRAAAVRARLAGAGAEALLVSSLTNIRWLTGFTGSNGWVVVGPDDLVLVTDGRYGDQAEAQLATAGTPGRVRVAPNGPALIAAVAAESSGFGALGFEAHDVTVHQHTQLQSAGLPRLVPTVGLVEAGRRRKDAAEIAAIARACAIADQALAEVLADLPGGLTEADVRNRLDARMRELGASGPSYDTIVAAGPVNGALPHHRPTSTPLTAGDLVVIDVGALVDGYHSDMTRTFCVGPPTADQLDKYDLVLRAQLAGLAAVRPGTTGRDVDAACRSIISDAGLGEWFSHGTGHGVGLLIHEDPYNTAASADVLADGDVVTVEPGVYRGGFGGIRVEDLVVVTSDGCRVLTSSPKDSLCPLSPPTT